MPHQPYKVTSGYIKNSSVTINTVVLYQFQIHQVTNSQVKSQFTVLDTAYSTANTIKFKCSNNNKHSAFGSKSVKPLKKPQIVTLEIKTESYKKSHTLRKEALTVPKKQ